MNNKINCEIRTFQKEETIRKIKLESKQKKELKSCQKNEDTVMGSVIEFRRELEELSNTYDRMNTTMNEKFISQYFIQCYENYEADLNEIIKRNLDNVIESQNSNFSIAHNVETSSVFKDDYQRSLYLKYDAKMKEIEARTELASLDAQIAFINSNNKCHEVIHNDNLQHDIFNEIRSNVKTLFIDQTTLELRSYLLDVLEIQKENVTLLSSLLGIWKQRLARGKMRLVALNKEMKTHDDLLGIMESIPGLLSLLATVNDQIKNVADAVGREEIDSSLPNQQLLTKLKSEPSAILEPLLRCLDSVQSTIATCGEQRIKNNDILVSITDYIENSRYCLENICGNLINFQNITTTGPFGDSSRMSLVAEAHLDEYKRLQTDAGKVKDKLKMTKEGVQTLSGDIALGISK